MMNDSEAREHEAQSLQEMLIDITHGLQTPLTIIKGELHFLKRDLPGNKRIAVCEQMVHDMSFLIYDLLHLARLDRTNIEHTKTDINLSQLLGAVAEYVLVLADSKEIQLITQIEPDIWIQGIQERIEELIINLVSNSMKYIGENEKKITLTLIKEDGCALFTITDTGIGIDPENLPYVFKRFYRVKNRNGESVKGSGLGLAIAQKIAEKHSAAIEVESTIGVGTTITVRFAALSANPR